MGFWAGAWLHDAPDSEYGADGKRAIVKHLCFGPLETQIWYESKDGQYFCEHQLIEGLQAGDRFVDAVSRRDMLEVLANEIALCEKHSKPEWSLLFQAEKEKLENNLNFM